MLPLSACYLTPHTHIFNKREGNRNREFIFAKTVTAKKILKLSLPHIHSQTHLRKIEMEAGAGNDSKYH